MIFPGRTNIYTVHLHEDQDMVLVREGFSWGAFLFGPLWALYNRLWFVAILLLLLSALFGYADEHGVTGDATLAILQLAIGILIGYQANDWRRTRLHKLGYTLVDVVAASSIKRAQLRFLDHYLPSHA